MKIIEIILQIDYIIPLTILDKFLKKKGFHLIHMNARSLVSNFTLIQPIIENSNIDICTVSESWLHDLIPDKFIEIPGYQIVRQDRNRIAYGDKKKYLGVTLDKNLNYKLHIDNLLKTLKYKIYILAKLRPYLTTQSSLNIYKTTIMPYIDYGDIFYQAAFKGSLAKIQDRQTKALKICFKLHGNQDENDLHARANLAILEKRRNSHILNFMYKRKENPVYLDQKNLQTRAYQAPKFIVPNFNIIQFKNSILYKGSSMWNELHNETKNIPTYLAFKEKTKILSKQ